MKSRGAEHGAAQRGCKSGSAGLPGTMVTGGYLCGFISRQDKIKWHRKNPGKIMSDKLMKGEPRKIQYDHGRDGTSDERRYINQHRWLKSSWDSKDKKNSEKRNILYTISTIYTMDMIGRDWLSYSVWEGTQCNRSRAASQQGSRMLQYFQKRFHFLKKNR